MRLLKLTLWCFLVLAPITAFAQEKIDSFDAKIQINKDASVNVSETINYDFGVSERHGIYRYIPVKYPTSFGNTSISVSDVSVTDELGNPYNFEISNSGLVKSIKIGDANLFVTGRRTYVINYKVKKAINYFSSHDEFYWNVTGSNWTVPIVASSASVILPSSVNESDIQIECFIGPLGSQNKCPTLEKSNNEARFSAGNLGVSDGLTVVVGWPKGVVVQPTQMQIFLAAIMDNVILFFPLLVFIIMFVLWSLYGKEPKGRGVVVAQYEVPDNLTPGEVGAIIDQKIDNKDISGEIINLAIKGYLKIVRIPKAGFFSKEDYKLVKLKPADNQLNDAEKMLMDSFFASNALTEITLSQLKNSFYLELIIIKKSIFNRLILDGYFSSDPLHVRGIYTTIGSVIMFLGFWLARFGGAWFIAFIISGLIVIFFGAIMPSKTIKGSETKELILGLKEYLSVAEKDRIEFFNAPSKTPERFEKLLPYAMVLGVEKEWAKQFEGIYNQSPNWYSDPSGSMFNSIILANSLSNFSTTTNSAMVAHSSGAGGGSGFGGGGFSGGGFGGGGGGSW